MKYVACLLALSALVTSSAFAQTSSSSAMPHFAPAPPPPGMNDPGVNPSKEPAAASTSKPVSSPAELAPSHMPGKPIPTPRVAGVPASERDANGQPPPDVTVRQQGDNTIQEYRQNGRVYMVVITPKHGPQQIYNVDPNGHMFDPNGKPPVKPVMYKVMQWGGSRPVSSSSAGGNGS